MNAQEELKAKGSITQIPILTMPEDDKNPPNSRFNRLYYWGTNYSFSRIKYEGNLPPIDVLPSLSRLKDKGIGEGKTREDHSGNNEPIVRCLCSRKRSKELSVILGEAALSDVDKLYAEFATKFEEVYVNQGNYTDRSIEEKH